MKEKYSMENVESEVLYRLLIQVVKFAIVDYKKALNMKRKLWNKPKTDPDLAKALGTIAEIEKFFRGTLFGSSFPNVDPEYIIKRIRSYE